MAENTPTPEQVQQHIKAALDSVNLVNGIIAGTKMPNATLQEKKAAVSRNVEHLELMMGKTWFAEGCTSIQTTNLNACIAAGNTYVG
jgi:hypothetical protein